MPATPTQPETGFTADSHKPNISQAAGEYKIINSDPPDLDRHCGLMLIVLAFGVILSQFL